jgi:hypothetical protein
MNIIDLSSLIPQTEENEEVLAVIYRQFQDDYFNAVDIPGKLLVSFVKLAYPDSYRLYCKNTYLLEGKSKKFFFLLINAGGLNTPEGVDIYLKNKRLVWWKILCSIALLPALPLIKAILNKVLKSELSYEQLDIWTKVYNLVKVYLSAGYDVEFSSGLLKGRRIENPYSRLRKEFDDKQLKILKAMGRVDNWEIVFNQDRATEKLRFNLENNLGCNAIESLKQIDIEKVKRYQVFRGYWNQVLNEVIKTGERQPR